MNSRDDTDFAQAYEQALTEVALPAFAAAGEYARAHGLLCHVGLHRGAGGLSELGLHARRPGEGLDCRCLISAAMTDARRSAEDWKSTFSIFAASSRSAGARLSSCPASMQWWAANNQS